MSLSVLVVSCCQLFIYRALSKQDVQSGRRIKYIKKTWEAFKLKTQNKLNNKYLSDIVENHEWKSKLTVLESNRRDRDLETPQNKYMPVYKNRLEDDI